MSPHYTNGGVRGATTNRFFPALGNHDWEAKGAAPYLHYFTLPGNERYYDLTWGAVHLFVIDSDRDEPDGVANNSPQAHWLQRMLATSTSCWNLVTMHHPSFSSGKVHGSSAWMQWPYQAWGADVVLVGHDHTYERIVRDGFPYFVNGLSGSSKYPFTARVAGSQVRYNDDYGAMLIKATRDNITFQFITRAGTVIDTYRLNKHCR